MAIYILAHEDSEKKLVEEFEAKQRAKLDVVRLDRENPFTGNNTLRTAQRPRREYPQPPPPSNNNTTTTINMVDIM
jgi:hypothetical protein